MKKLIDKGLDFLRNHTYLDFLGSNEHWLVRIGLICLYAVIPVLSLILIANFESGFERIYGNVLLIVVAVLFACIVMGYVADKMLEYVKPTIKQSQTNIINGALLDVLSVILLLCGVAILISGLVIGIRVESFSIFMYSVFAFVGLEYMVSMLLNPEKTLSIKVQESATPAQSLIAISSLLIKAFYRLVPVIFGSTMILSVISLLGMLFADSLTVYTLESAISTFVIGALTPLIGYFLFLINYFILDVFSALFRIADAVTSKNKTK